MWIQTKLYSEKINISINIEYKKYIQYIQIILFKVQLINLLNLFCIINWYCTAVVVPQTFQFAAKNEHLLSLESHANVKSCDHLIKKHTYVYTFEKYKMNTIDCYMINLKIKN